MPVIFTRVDDIPIRYGDHVHISALVQLVTVRKSLSELFQIKSKKSLSYFFDFNVKNKERGTPGQIFA